MYSYHLSNRKSTSKSNYNTGNISRFFGRVTKVILDGDPVLEEKPEYLYGVYYRLLNVDIEEQNFENQSIALQGNPYIKTLPLEGEIVVIELRISDNLNVAQNRVVGYWLDIVNIWNTPQHNVLPDTRQANWKSNILGGIVESSFLRPLKQFLGDILIEGRFGQFLRLSGESLTQKGIKGDQSTPYISIGIQSNKSVDTVVREDEINQNRGTLLLVSNHEVDLSEPVTVQKSFKEIPGTVKSYKGSQGILKSGRIILDADIDSVLIRGKNSIAQNAKNINLDASDYIGLNAEKLYIGSVGNKRESEPALLGDTSEKWLQDLISMLQTLVQSCETASSVTGGPVIQLNVIAPSLKAQLEVLERRLKSLKSKKVYIA